jgi:hypothetical protein
VVTGVIEFMGDIQGSFKTCEKDLTTMWGNFTAAFHDFTDEKSIVWEFEHDIPKVRCILRLLLTVYDLYCLPYLMTNTMILSLRPIRWHEVIL